MDEDMDEKAREQIGIGSHVVVELVDADGGSEELAFDLVSEDAADIVRGAVSVASPLGAAVRGRFVGDDLAYTQADVRRLRIVSVGPAKIEAEVDAAARRQAVLEEARRKAERTNAEMFSSSYSGKWGDYDMGDGTK